MISTPEHHIPKREKLKLLDPIHRLITKFKVVNAQISALPVADILAFDSAARRETNGRTPPGKGEEINSSIMSPDCLGKIMKKKAEGTRDCSSGRQRSILLTVTNTLEHIMEKLGDLKQSQSWSSDKH